MKLSRLTALLEQGFISGSNFLILIFAARVLAPADWGIFSFAMASVLMIQGLQRAAVILPMVNQCATVEGLTLHQGNWYRMQLFASAISASFLLTAALLPFYPERHTWLSSSAWIATILVGPVYYYEFNRRLLILRGLQQKLVPISICYSGVLALGTVVLLWAQAQSLVGVFLVYLTAQLAGALLTGVTLGIPRRTTRWTRDQMTENMRFAKWAFLSSIAFSGYNFAIQGMLAAISGPGAVGLFNAARNLVQPVNTLVQAMDSVDKPRTSRMYAESGDSGLFKAVLASLRWLVLLGGPFVLLMGVVGDDLLHMFYGGRYLGQHDLMIAWAVAAAMILIAHPTETGLLVKRAARQLFYSRLLAAVVALALAAYLIPAAGALGAVMSLASGWALAAMVGFAFLQARSW